MAEPTTFGTGGGKGRQGAACGNLAKTDRVILALQDQINTILSNFVLQM
jgi:hypothetical protein